MRSRIALLGGVVSLTAGCGFRSAGGAADATPTPDACVTFSSQLDTCPLTLTAELVLTGPVAYDTTLHVLTIGGVVTPVASQVISLPAGSVDALLVHDLSMTASANLRATGMWPLAIIASGSVTIDASAIIDVGAGGAGARITCDVTTAMPGAANSAGAGGGGGGGYGATGGDGGQGNSDGAVRGDGGAKGLAAAAIPAGPLGGCPGASGGKGGVVGGVGGPAGGALDIISATTITLGPGATLTAGGGGGTGGGHGTKLGDDGGGGGGSGGMIILEAPHLAASQSVIVANGGGGGEGSSEEGGGGMGDNGSLTTMPAGGGKGGSTNGSDGGAGGSSDAVAGALGGGPLPGGGGGGGGGVGFVHFISADPQVGVVSPAPQ